MWVPAWMVWSVLGSAAVALSGGLVWLGVAGSRSLDPLAALSARTLRGAPGSAPPPTDEIVQRMRLERPSTPVSSSHPTPAGPVSPLASFR